jgi:ABC-type uncharacterized transport system substrate-binding protein
MNELFLYLHILPIIMLLILIILYAKIKKLQATRRYLHDKRKRLVIAIMIPSTIQVVQEVLRPLIAHIKKYASFEFESIECIHNLNRDQAEEWAHFISESKVDLILSLGKLSTEVMYNTMKTCHAKIPMISVGSPLGHNDIPFETMQKYTQITGVVTQMDWPAKINLLKKILPHIKNVLIVFRSIDEISHSNLKEKNLITTSLRKYHIAWKMHHVPTIEKSTDFTAQLLDNIDIVILSRSSEILKFASRIALEAQKFNIPVLSPDITCPDVFLGISECPERAIGLQSAKYAIEILEDNMCANSLPLKEIKDREKIVLYPHNTSPMIATTAIGNLLTQSNIINLSIRENGE